jgi:DNA-binding MarR family transcriptional regulator
MSDIGPAQAEPDGWAIIGTSTRIHGLKAQVSPHDDSLGLVYLLKCAELAVRGCAEVVLARFRLTPALFLVLFRLRQSEGVSSADLARTIGVRPQSIVDLIRPLEKAGLIRRRQAREHRRILRISLTAAGERLLERAIPAARQVEEEIFASLSTQQILNLREGLTKLLESAQAHEKHPPVKRAVPAKKPRAGRARPAAAPMRSRARLSGP